MKLADLPASTIARIELEKLRVGCQHVLDNATLHEVRDEAIEQMMLSLRSYVLAEKLVGDSYTAHYCVPANAWQMIKERHAPAWFRRRFPVRYDRKETAVTFERYATYPDAKIRLEPTLGKAVLYERTHQSDWRAT